MKSTLEKLLFILVAIFVVGAIVQIVLFVIKVILWTIGAAILLALALVLLVCIGKSLHFFYVRYRPKAK